MALMMVDEGIIKGSMLKEWKYTLSSYGHVHSEFGQPSISHAPTGFYSWHDNGKMHRELGCSSLSSGVRSYYLCAKNLEGRILLW